MQKHTMSGEIFLLFLRLVRGDILRVVARFFHDWTMRMTVVVTMAMTVSMIVRVATMFVKQKHPYDINHDTSNRHI